MNDKKFRLMFKNNFLQILFLKKVASILYDLSKTPYNEPINFTKYKGILKRIFYIFLDLKSCQYTYHVKEDENLICNHAYSYFGMKGWL